MRLFFIRVGTIASIVRGIGKIICIVLIEFIMGFVKKIWTYDEL